MKPGPQSPASAFILGSIDSWIAGRDEARPVQLVDLACGTGRHITAILGRGYLQTITITAADINADRLDRMTKGLGQGAAVRPVCVDLEQDGFVLADGLGQAQFDLVVVTNYLHRPLLDQIFGLVSPGGLIIYETFGQGNAVFGKPSSAKFLLQDGELATYLPAGFTLLHSFFGQRQELYPELSPAIICQFAAQRKR